MLFATYLDSNISLFDIVYCMYCSFLTMYWNSFFLNILFPDIFTNTFQHVYTARKLQGCRPRGISCMWCTIIHQCVCVCVYVLAVAVRIFLCSDSVDAWPEVVNPLKARTLVKQHISPIPHVQFHVKSEIPVATQAIYNLLQIRECRIYLPFALS